MTFDFLDHSGTVFMQEVFQRSRPHEHQSIRVGSRLQKFSNERDCLRPTLGDHIVDVLSRALRGPLEQVVVLAEYDPTAAEEMPGQSEPRAAAAHRGGEGPHGPVGDRERLLHATAS